jgi:arginyl-tRNA synthetase
MNLLHFLQQQLLTALTGYVPEPETYLNLLKPTKDSKFGDYQANCAMPIANKLGRNKEARAVATEIIARLPLGDALEKPEIAGPGFINIRFKTAWLAQQLQAIASDERLGVAPVAKPQNYVVDYSSPNVAKPMHVGHLRSTIIGDALARLLRFLGHTVVSDNHLGDWGTQMGMLIYGYKHHRDEAALQTDPLREMARLYVLVRNLTKAADEEEKDEEEQTPKYTDEQKAAATVVLEACRQETVKLHAGDPENNRLWKMMMPWCLADLDRIYQRLDIHFDHTLGESFYNPFLADVVADLDRQGILQESKGAKVIPFGENQPPAMVQKRDGAFTYTTTDLATIRYRAEQFKAEVMLYVVDFRQALHFQQLFESARRWGYGHVRMEHIQFGSVTGQDRKPIKTREGGAIELSNLLDEAVNQARPIVEENSSELTPEEKANVAEAVGLGAVKYADLCQNRTTNYIFSWEKMLAMNGNTGTYMQYAYARNRNIFSKGEVDPAMLRTAPPLPLLNTPQERALAMTLLRFPEALADAAVDFKPNLITDYLWDLANTYSGFYQNCPVLKAETPELRQSRLLLCDLTARVLQRGLNLLGIRTIERM